MSQTESVIRQVSNLRETYSTKYSKSVFCNLFPWTTVSKSSAAYKGNVIASCTNQFPLEPFQWELHPNSWVTFSFGRKLDQARSQIFLSLITGNVTPSPADLVANHLLLRVGVSIKFPSIDPLQFSRLPEGCQECGRWGGKCWDWEAFYSLFKSFWSLFGCWIIVHSMLMQTHKLFWAVTYCSYSLNTFEFTALTWHSPFPFAPFTKPFTSWFVLGGGFFPPLGKSKWGQVMN